jgi:hypothetical protein
VLQGDRRGMLEIEVDVIARASGAEKPGPMAARQNSRVTV